MQRVTAPKKGWKRPFEKNDDDSIKRERVTGSTDIGEEQRRQHAWGEFDTISDGRVV